jgi:hypothetical protein
MNAYNFGSQRTGLVEEQLSEVRDVGVDNVGEDLLEDRSCGVAL